jgi:TRAP-type mannitol/chloroaromatic compound transport system permease small subunit
VRILDTYIMVVDRVNDSVGKILWIGIFVNFVFMFLEVILRYVFNAPTIWANELSQYIFGAYVVLVAGFLLKQKMHTNVDILYNHLSKRGQALAEITTFPFTFIFTSVLLILGSSFAWNSLEKFENSITAWSPPIYPVKMLIPVAAFLLLNQSIVELIRSIRRFLSERRARLTTTLRMEVKENEH